MTILFQNRAEIMGLTTTREGIFEYSDRYSQLKYEEIVTKVNQQYIPMLALFTRPPESEWTSSNDEPEFKYQGTVSDKYKFRGNAQIIDSILQSISEFGTPIHLEKTNMDFYYTQIWSEIEVSNGRNKPEVGDILPQFVIRNSYNGKMAVSVSFGLSFYKDNYRYGFGFRNKISSLREVHIESSKTTMSSALSSYIEKFPGGILDLLDVNLSNKLTEDDVIRVLGLVEEIGKRKRVEVSGYLEEIGADNISSWNMFLAILRFSTIEQNLNVKQLMENIAESVLVIPVQMMEVFDEVNRKKVIE